MLRNLLTIVLLGLVLYFGLRVAGRMGRDDYPAGYPLPQLTLKPSSKKTPAGPNWATVRLSMNMIWV